MTATLETTETIVTAEATLVRDALTACLLSVDRSRTALLPVLAAVRIEHKAGELVFTSTDRYRLTRVTIATDAVGQDWCPPDWSVLVERADAERFVKSLPTKGLRQPAHLSTEGEMVKLTTFDGSTTARALDAQYPAVESVIPQGSNATEQIGFDPKRMADLCKMPGRRTNEPVQLTFNGTHKPMRAEWGEAPISYLHILMPTRISS